MVLVTALPLFFEVEGSERFVDVDVVQDTVLLLTFTRSLMALALGGLRARVGGLLFGGKHGQVSPGPDVIGTAIAIDALAISMLATFACLTILGRLLWLVLVMGIRPDGQPNPLARDPIEGPLHATI